MTEDDASLFVCALNDMQGWPNKRTIPDHGELRYKKPKQRNEYKKDARNISKAFSLGIRGESREI